MDLSGPDVKRIGRKNSVNVKFLRFLCERDN